MSRSDDKCPIMNGTHCHGKIIGDSGLWDINDRKYGNSNFTNSYWLRSVMDLDISTR